MTSRRQSLASAMTTAINQQLAGGYGTEFTLVQTPSQGNFLWNYLSESGAFNDGTFGYVSASVAPSADGVLAQLSPAGGFVNAYTQVIAPIYYRLSSADQLQIGRTTSAAQRDALSMVTAYEQAFGVIASADLLTASQACGPFALQTAHDYVLTYVLGYLWSGRCIAGGAPLTYADLAGAGSRASLQALLPETPTDGQSTVIAAWTYLDAIERVVSIQSAAQLASWTLAQLTANVAQPEPANGGMQTVDPRTGKVLNGWQVGYAIGVAPAAIGTALADASRVLTVVIDIPPATSASTVIATVNGVGEVAIDISTAALFTDAGGSLLNLLTSAGSSASVKITITYTGYTLIPLAPATFDPATSAGWFLADPITQASAHGNADVTGYAFAIAPPVDLQSFAAGGNFGMLTSLLISNPPSITFTYIENDPTLSLSLLSAGISGTLTLFGDVLQTQCQLDLDAPDPAITFTTAAADVAGPALMQSAFVIGCTLSNPGVAL